MQIKKALTKDILDQIKQLYIEAFPKSERKPWELLLQKQQEGTMELLSIEEDGNFLGLAIFAFDKDLALLDYFAISDSQRGQGVGSKAIRMLQNHYHEKRFLLEIESTKVDAENITIRKSRKDFYLRNGLHVINFDVNLFGVEMEILANCSKLNFEEYRDIYRNACKAEYAEKISLVREWQED